MEELNLVGPRTVLAPGDPMFPAALVRIPLPPKKLYVVGDPSALKDGLAIVGGLRSTPYGTERAARFAGLAASMGVTLVSGGPRGLGSAVLEAALEAGGTCVVVQGPGCDRPYPPENIPLFQRVIDAGGAVISEREWEMEPLPYMFRERNRLIAGLSKAVLLVESSAPSGTYSLCQDALACGHEAWAVPGPDDSPMSAGPNLLLREGATAIVDDVSFLAEAARLFDGDGR